MTAISRSESVRARSLSDAQREAALGACARIAPTWPLDELIAVNPWWELRDMPLPEASARLAATAHARCLMPREYYAGKRASGLADEHLRAAAEELGAACTVDELEAHLERDAAEPHWHNFSDLMDSGPDRRHHMAWRDEITHQISQFCAAVFQRGGALRPPKLRPGELYRRWLANTRQDRGIAILMGEPLLPGQFDALPQERGELIAEALHEHEIPLENVTDYAWALLLDVNGWASWIAWLRWQDRLDGRDSDLMLDLLAIRMAWELALSRHQAATDPERFRLNQSHWRRQLEDWSELLRSHREGQRLTWVWQRATETAWQDALHRQLRTPAPKAPPADRPSLQAAFCIDVRSEVMRRALEAQDPSIRTIGFAGFFGLPIDYSPAGTDLHRPQLPGLLKPALRASEIGETRGVDRRFGLALNRKARWSELPEEPAASFSMVEATGLLYAFKLLRDSLFPRHHEHPVNDLHAGGDWQLSRDGRPLDAEECADLAAGILRAMGLEGGFAPLVLLVGHGSSTRNNPHAAGLDCGACGGQTGEVNVRVLAMLLNDADVRRALDRRGIELPEDTRFVAALHDTTTDRLECLEQEAESLPEQRLAGWLRTAGATARRERAPGLGLEALDDAALERAVSRRSRDWSQVRPEWGLAGNAAFIVAPRDRTRHLGLQGRAFLHDYDWRRDEGFSVLELIMTAPMLVTNWINLQYYASVTDNLKYGSGNKVLHNVVGGNIGVFEGNGGDLRIGLPMQSLHDGLRWVHEPLRLSVYLAAPRQAITDIYRRHDAVRQLVDNEWLFLFRLDDDGRTIERLRDGRWRADAQS